MLVRKRFLLVLLLIGFQAWSSRAGLTPTPGAARPRIGSETQTQAPSATVTVVGQTAGPTPFIAQIQLSVDPPDSLQKIQFTISPKPGSVTRPISATYMAEYLQDHGFLDNSTGTVRVAIFGLYADYSNSVTLTSWFVDGSSQVDVLNVVTDPFVASCGFDTHEVVQARTSSTDLSYDYMLVKVQCGNQSPVIFDTDGAIRWVGTAGIAAFSSIFFENGFYVASRPPTSASFTGITRIELDGTFRFMHDYADLGIVRTDHHNYDPGKQGILVEVDTTNQVESAILEVDACGNVLKTWNLAQIIGDAMTAGGDDPSQFVRSAPIDWFHNNAAAYRKSDDSLIVSSRESFVICLDYETGAIKWILGDPTKKWHQFPSLRSFALSLGPNTLPPIGQHAVSFTHDDDLLLFDDGENSIFQSPAGDGRTYSAPRKYHIDLQSMTATEVWNYPSNEALKSGFCSSVYEDAPSNYLVDYTLTGDLLGLDAMGNKAFHYRYNGNCGVIWNAIPIHLENLIFTGLDQLAAPGGWRISSISFQGSSVVVRFPAMSGKTYRLEYKESLNDAEWTVLSEVTPQCSGTVPVTDRLTAGRPSRFYQVRLLEP